jgi:hypothetical protein
MAAQGALAVVALMGVAALAVVAALAESESLLPGAVAS